MRAKKGLQIYFLFFWFCFFLYKWVTNLIFYQHETLKRKREVAYFTTYYDLHSTLIFNHLADFTDD